MRDSSENQQQEREALWPTELPTVFFLMTADYVLNSNILSFIPNIDDLNLLSVFFSDLLAIHQFY